MTDTLCFHPSHEIPLRSRDGETCEHEAKYYRPADLTVPVLLTYGQLVLLEVALEANLYEEAPQYARNQGFALDPDDEEDGVEIDEDDEEEVRYRDTYRETKNLEQVLLRAKAQLRNT